MKFLLILLAVLLITAKCATEETATVDCGGVSVSYSTQVATIVTTRCATNSACHGSGSSRGPGALTSYAQVFNNRSAIETAVANGSMPMNGTLTSDQKNAILCWIENGAENN